MRRYTRVVGAALSPADRREYDARKSLMIARAVFLYSALSVSSALLRSIGDARPAGEVALAGLLLVFMVVGLVRVPSRPRAWCLALAAVLLVRALLVGRSGGSYVSLWVAPAFLLATWSAVRRPATQSGVATTG